MKVAFTREHLALEALRDIVVTLEWADFPGRHVFVVQSQVQFQARRLQILSMVLVSQIGI